MGNSTERKKWQNRLRQRAWRQRRSARRALEDIAPVDKSAWKGYGLLQITTLHDSNFARENAVNKAYIDSEQAVHAGINLPKSLGECRKTPKKDRKIPPLLPYISSRTINQDLLHLSFPLSADHHLITLVQYNVVRAILFNMSILSMMHHLPLGCGLLLQIPCFDDVPPDKVPPNLQPSLLQRSVPHLFWIDAIPFPKVRDNIISMSEQYDSNDLFYDLGQSLYEGFDDAERCGFVAWGNPWSASDWEVSEGFVKKWGFLLTGCAEVIDSTNRWRDIRGEDSLLTYGIEL